MQRRRRGSTHRQFRNLRLAFAPVGQISEKNWKFGLVRLHRRDALHDLLDRLVTAQPQVLVLHHLNRHHGYLRLGRHLNVELLELVELGHAVQVRHHGPGARRKVTFLEPLDDVVVPLGRVQLAH